MKKITLPTISGLIALLIAFSAGLVLGTWIVPDSHIYQGDKGEVAQASLEVPAKNCLRPEINYDNFIILLNEYRLELGLNQLSYDPVLTQHAEVRLSEIKDLPKVTHQTKAERPANMYWTELLYRDTSNTETACDYMRKFKESPTHNSGLIDPKYDKHGIATDGDTVVILEGLYSK